MTSVGGISAAGDLIGAKRWLLQVGAIHESPLPSEYNLACKIATPYYWFARSQCGLKLPRRSRDRVPPAIWIAAVLEREDHCQAPTTVSSVA